MPNCGIPRFTCMYKSFFFLLIGIALSCRTEKNSAANESAIVVCKEVTHSSTIDSLSIEMSPATKIFISRLKELSWQPDEELINQFNLRKIESVYYVGAIITVNEGADGKDLEGSKVLIGTKAGNYWTVKIPVSAFSNISKWNSVQYIKVDQPLLKR